jgi:hypothetical protein
MAAEFRQYIQPCIPQIVDLLKDNDSDAARRAGANALVKLSEQSTLSIHSPAMLLKVFQLSFGSPLEQHSGLSLTIPLLLQPHSIGRSLSLPKSTSMTVPEKWWLLVVLLQAQGPGFKLTETSSPSSWLQTLVRNCANSVLCI